LTLLAAPPGSRFYATTQSSRAWAGNKQTASFGSDVPILSGAFFKFADRPRTVGLQGTYRF